MLEKLFKSLIQDRYNQKCFFFFSISMCWLAPFETLCQVHCKGVGGVWFPCYTGRWLVFNVNKLHFLQSVSLEQYSIFARKFIKKLSNSARFISIFIIIYIFIKNQNKPSLCHSDQNNKRSEDMIKLFLQEYI